MLPINVSITNFVLVQFCAVLIPLLLSAILCTTPAMLLPRDASAVYAASEYLSVCCCLALCWKCL